MMDSHKRIIGLTAFVAVAGVGLIVTAVASDHWVNTELKGNSTVNRSQSAEMSFGLFNGEGTYDLGLSARVVKLELKCDLSESICGYINVLSSKSESDFEDQVKLYKNGTSKMALEDYGLFGFALFAASLVMLSLSVVFGLIAISFAIFNVFGRPIESITGVAGLYVWNAAALLFVLTGIGVYMGLFYTQLSHIISNSMFDVEGTVWQDDSEFQWSFFCVIGSAGAFLINIMLLLISGKKCSFSCSKVGVKEVDNGIILY